MHHKIKQLIMNQRGKRSAKTYTTGTLSTLWGQMCMSETVISLVWVSKKTKTLSEMQDRPTTTHYSTSSSTNKQVTMRFLNKQCFAVVIITIPSLSNIHQSAAFYQKTYKPNKKDIYNHKEIDINFHKQKVKGFKQKKKLHAAFC